MYVQIIVLFTLVRPVLRTLCPLLPGEKLAGWESITASKFISECMLHVFEAHYIALIGGGVSDPPRKF